MVGIKLAYYRREDWKRLLRMIDDRDGMHDKWKDWHKDFENAKQQLTLQGFEVIDVVVDLDELMKYCEQNGLENNGKARSQFAQLQ